MPKRSTNVAKAEATDQARDTREHILQVAMREFAEKGPGGARVDEIAHAAGVNKQLLYYYFRNKDGLYRAALEHTIADYHAQYRGTPDFGRFAERVSEHAREQSHEYVTRWRRMVLWEALQLNAETVGEAHASHQGWRDGLAQIVRAQEEGEFDPRLDPEMLTLAMIGMLNLPHLLPQATRSVTGLHCTDEEFLERHAEFFETVLHMLAPVRSRRRR